MLHMICYGMVCISYVSYHMYNLYVINIKLNLERNGLELDDLDAVQHWADKIKEELNRNRFKIDIDNLVKFRCTGEV